LKGFENELKFSFQAETHLEDVRMAQAAVEGGTESIKTKI
jgi:hypothetical protein